MTILDDDLGLAVRAQPGDAAILALDCHDLTELIGKVVRVRVKGLSVPFVCCVTKHKTLIASTKLRLLFTSVHGSKDVSVLLLDVSDNIAISSVKADILRCVANLLADFTGNLLEVDLTLVDEACLSK